MDIIEFSKKILQILDVNLLQVTIKKATAKGFVVQGFTKNVWMAPESILCAALEKRKKGKYQGEVFLETLCELDIDNEVICLAREWMQNQETREKVENEVDKIILMKKEKQKINKIENQSKFEEEIEENIGCNEQNTQQLQKKVKKYQGIIQDYRIGLDNKQKEIVHLQREIKRLEKKLEDKEKENNDLVEKYLAINGYIKNLEEQLNEKNSENLMYQEMVKRLPRVICFSKKSIDNSLFPLYRIEQYHEWIEENKKNIKWDEYQEIWVVETDFNYPEVMAIKNMPHKKLVLSCNIKSLIEKVGGNK